MNEGFAFVKNRKWFFVLYFSLILYALSGVCSKLASSKAFLSTEFILLYGGLIGLLGVYAILWQQIIKHLPLSTAYANKAFTIVLGLVFGALFFQEKASPRQLIGAVIVIAGILLYVRSDEEKYE